MKLVKTLQLMYRRKLAILPVLLIGVLLVTAAYKNAPPSYKANGSIVLLTPSPTISTGAGSPAVTAVSPANPYLDFGTLSPVVDVLARRLNTGTVASELHAQGLQGSYIVGANIAYYHGPIIDISSTAKSGRDALNSVLLVMKEAGKELSAVQAEQHVAAADFITTAPVVTPNRATKVVSTTIRTLIAVGLIDILGLVGAAYAAEKLAARRASRRQAQSSLDAVRSTEDDLPLVSLTWTRRPAVRLESSPVETLRS